MRTITLYLRFRGVRLINYLDDFFFLVSDSPSTAHRQLGLDTFKSAGLAINDSKSHLQFTRLLTHLNFVIDLDSGSFEVPLERWESLQQLITVALSRQKLLVHLLSRIAGHLSSMILAIGPIALIKSRQCHSYLKQYSLQFYVAISDGLRDELTYWSHLSRTHFTKRFSLPPLPLTFPYGVMLEQQVGVPRWRIKNCRHKVSSPSSCGMAHPVAH
jgi:hypothetical protein